MKLQAPKSKNNYRESIVETAKDGKWRSVEELREDAGIPDTANLTRFLKNLKAKLVIERSEYRLRITKEKGSAGRFLWRLASKDEGDIYKVNA